MPLPRHLCHRIHQTHSIRNEISRKMSATDVRRQTLPLASLSVHSCRRPTPQLPPLVRSSIRALFVSCIMDDAALPTSIPLVEEKWNRRHLGTCLWHVALMLSRTRVSSEDPAKRRHRLAAITGGAVLVEGEWSPSRFAARLHSRTSDKTSHDSVRDVGHWSA